jgi:hypothetical protein
MDSLSTGSTQSWLIVVALAFETADTLVVVDRHTGELLITPAEPSAGTNAPLVRFCS